MGLLDVVRSGVKIADGITKDLQASVTLERYLSDDGYGTVVFAAPVVLRAIEDRKQKIVKNTSGQEVLSSATLTFLDVAALGVGVDVKDRITLSNGTISPILNTGGFVDAGTTRPVATEIYLG